MAPCLPFLVNEGGSIMKRLFLVVALLTPFARIDSGTAAQAVCPGDFMTQEWIGCRKAVIDACAFVGPSQSSACEAAALQRYLPTQQSRQQQSQQQQPGAVAPVSAWDCPVTHVIKGNFTTYSGERCIFHIPGGQFYSKTKPERCYRTLQDAIADGCRQSLR